MFYHSLFKDAAEKLAAFKNKNGISTVIIDVDAIYNEFNNGEFSPEAIRRFVAYVFQNWAKPKPANIIFMGDSSRDYRGEYRNEVVNYVPIYVLGEKRSSYASDYWYVAVAGDDDIPDMNVGRISVNNPEDADNIVEKIIRYSTHNESADWQKRLAFISDDSEGFHQRCDELIRDYTPAAYEVEKIYLDDFKFEDNFYVPKEKLHMLKQYNKVSPDCNKAIFELLHKGTSIIEFYGHGAPNIWTDERIWFGGDSLYSDNKRLDNIDKLPLIINMTCSTGAIDFPDKPWNICIGEDMLRTKNGGGDCVVFSFRRWFYPLSFCCIETDSESFI